MVLLHAERRLFEAARRPRCFDRRWCDWPLRCSSYPCFHISVSFQRPLFSSPRIISSPRSRPANKTGAKSGGTPTLARSAVGGCPQQTRNSAVYADHPQPRLRLRLASADDFVQIVCQALDHSETCRRRGETVCFGLKVLRENSWKSAQGEPSSCRKA